eukprot:TRINITY_DN2629_c0_g1_i6.p1 TRINITY_DN2629_c0_g1~~TRINITY_DN2629_c0_g1_i6.p1  ORF type:complete len:1345 (-),score=304.96 TRINITY_DN2629_c0_g1_i6:29-3835(-)
MVAATSPNSPLQVIAGTSTACGATVAKPQVVMVSRDVPQHFQMQVVQPQVLVGSSLNGNSSCQMQGPPGAQYQVELPEESRPSMINVPPSSQMRDSPTIAEYQVELPEKSRPSMSNVPPSNQMRDPPPVVEYQVELPEKSRPSMINVSPSSQMRDPPPRAEYQVEPPQNGKSSMMPFLGSKPLGETVVTPQISHRAISSNISNSSPPVQVQAEGGQVREMETLQVEDRFASPSSGLQASPKLQVQAVDRGTEIILEVSPTPRASETSDVASRGEAATPQGILLPQAQTLSGVEAVRPSSPAARSCDPCNNNIANDNICVCGNILADNGSFCMRCGVAKHVSDVSDTSRCTCGSVFTQDANFCRKCGADRKTAEPEIAIKCTCGSIFMQDAMFCRKCGVERKTVESEDSIRCACGNIFMEDSKFCRKCGAERGRVEACTTDVGATPTVDVNMNGDSIEETQISGQSETKDAMQCKCGNTFIHDSNFCRKCGAERKSGLVSTTAVGATPTFHFDMKGDAIEEAQIDGQGETLDVVRCMCGNIFMNDSNFCRKCGAERKSVDTCKTGVNASMTVDLNTNGDSIDQLQADDQSESADVIQCMCGNIFMDDSKFCRKCGAERNVAKALLAIERDEYFLMEEVSKLPNGRQALESLRGTSGPARDEALQYLKDHTNAAKERAQAQAAEATQLSRKLRADAQDAKDLADDAEDETKALEQEHEDSVELAKHAKEQEAAAEKEAQRLKELAQKAFADLEEARNARKAADDHHKTQAALHGHMVMKLEDAKRLARQMNLPVDPMELGMSLRTDQSESRRKKQDAERNRDLAAKAEEIVKEQSSLVARLEKASQPGGALEGLLHVQQLANGASKKKSIAVQARVKADSLAAQLAKLQQEAEFAERVAKKAETEARDAMSQATERMQQSKAAQDALNLRVSCAAGGGGPQLTPEAARQAGQEAQEALARARADVIRFTKKSAEDAEAAEKAGKQAAQKTEIMEGLSNSGGLDEDVDSARLAAEKAKAHAEALAAAAAAAEKHAETCHQRATRSEASLRDQQQRANELAKKERHFWQRRFGDGSAPTSLQPRRGTTEAAREKAAADQMLADAARAEEKAAEAEAQAARLDALLLALERARMFGEQMRPSKCECGNQFQKDENFCRTCGRPRMQGWSWDGYKKPMLPVRQQAKQAAADVEARLALAESKVVPEFFAPATQQFVPEHREFPVVPKLVEIKQTACVPASAEDVYIGLYSMYDAVAPESYFSVFNEPEDEIIVT